MTAPKNLFSPPDKVSLAPTELPCVVSYYQNGWRTGIFFRRGPMWVSFVSMEGMVYQAVHVEQWMKSREREFQQMYMFGQPYPAIRAARHFMNAAKTVGITKSARKVLEDILGGKSATPKGGNVTQTKGDDMALTIKIDTKKYKGATAQSGRKSYDSGDQAAKLLRGLSLDAAYKVASEYLGESKLALKRRYGKLNPGHQRMNIGNRIRKVLRDKE